MMKRGGERGGEGEEKEGENRGGRGDQSGTTEMMLSHLTWS